MFTIKCSIFCKISSDKNSQYFSVKIAKIYSKLSETGNFVGNFTVKSFYKYLGNRTK